MKEGHFKREATAVLLFPRVLILMGILVSLFAPNVIDYVEGKRCEDIGRKYDFISDDCVEIERSKEH